MYICYGCKWWFSLFANNKTLSLGHIFYIFCFLYFIAKNFCLFAFFCFLFFVFLFTISHCMAMCNCIVYNIYFFRNIAQLYLLLQITNAIIYFFYY